MTTAARHKNKIVVTYPSQTPVTLNAIALADSKNYGAMVITELIKAWGQSFVRGLIYLDEITGIFQGIKECLAEEGE